MTSRLVTPMRFQVGTLDFGFDTNSQLYYIRSGPIEQRGETWLTENQMMQLRWLLRGMKSGDDAE